MKTILFLFSLILLLISSCDFINPEEEIPSYITINDITVNTDYSEVTDAWVYIDGNLVGAFDLPAHFPVLATGEHTVMVRPGVKINGIAVTRDIYPIYTNWNANSTLVPEQTIELNPEVEYLSNVVFAIEETFESVAIKFETVDTAAIEVTKCDTVSNAPSGTVGGVDLEPDEYFKFVSVEKVMLNYNSKRFLEFSFRSEGYIEVAWTAENMVTGTIQQNSLYQTLPTNGEWKHVYLSLDDALTDFNTDIYKFQFKFGSMNIDDENVKYYLDNIRLIYTN